ncbi:MAG: hypothetical protein WDN06_07565 [Asticcacaulis sp.]
MPYTRGAEWSRTVSAIVQEAQALAAKGVREIHAFWAKTLTPIMDWTEKTNNRPWRA